MAEKLFEKAFQFASESIEITEKNVLDLGLSTKRITNAVLLCNVTSCEITGGSEVTVSYNNNTLQVIDYIQTQKDKRISINITEELNCLIRKAFLYCGGKKEDQISIKFKDGIKLGDIDLFVEFIPEQIMHENNAYVKFDVRRAGNGKVNLSTGMLRYSHQCGSIGLVYNDWQARKRCTAVYDAIKKKKYLHGVGKGFKLNIEQFLIKRKIDDNQEVYTYIDGDGNYHEFVNKYYYLIGEKKIYVTKNQVTVDLNGNLKYVRSKNYSKKIYTEHRSTSGLILSTDNSTFKNGQYIEQRQKEQIELEEQIASYEKQFEQYVITNSETGNNIRRLNLFIAKKTQIECFEEFLAYLKSNTLLFSTSQSEQYSNFLASVDKYKTSNKGNYPSDYYTQKSNYEKLSTQNEETLKKYFKQYLNNKHQHEQMIWQLPTRIITTPEGVYLAFNESGYLVALFDNYENQTLISYERGRISSVQTPDNKCISFEYYKDKRIKKIIDKNEKAYQLSYNKGLLTRIIDGNNEETRLDYDKYGYLQTIKDHYGYGVVFGYDHYGRVVKITNTSEIDSIVDGKVSKGSNKTKLLAEINYHDSHFTTTVKNEFGISTTYVLDILGRPVTVYEGDSTSARDSVRAVSYEYQDNQKNYSISENLNQKNLLPAFNETIKLYGIDKSTSNTASKTSRTLDIEEIKTSDATDYVFSAWAKADSAYIKSERSKSLSNIDVDSLYNINNDANKQNRKFEICAELEYDDNSTQTYSATFDWLNTDWQYISLPIEIERNNKEIRSLKIIIDYSNNVGEASFNGFALREGTWSYCTFDKNGKKTYSENSTNKTIVDYEYDDNERLIKELTTDRNGRKFTNTYEYNKQGSLIRSINHSGLVNETVYDDNGRAIRQITYNLDDPTSKLYKESQRDDKGKITADVDESGLYNSKEYIYEDDTSIVVKDGDGNQLAYGYKDGVQVSVSGNADGEESTNTMHYTANLLTKSKSGNTHINYRYDGWGRLKKVSIAGAWRVKIKHITSLKTKTTLANEDIIVEEKDIRSNIINQKVTYHDGKTESIINTFDPKTQKLTNIAVDINNEKKYNITRNYDVKGNLLKETRDGQYAISKIHTYSKDNVLLSSKYKVGEKTLDYEYETDHTPDKRDAKLSLPFSIEQKLAYDGIGRTQEITLGTNFVKDFYYAKYGDHATNRINTIWYGVNGIRKDNTRYTYDKLGNIETITENGVLIARYKYDGLNRLVREDNVHFGTVTYQYDAAGNILSKTRYTFTLSDSLNNGKAFKYEYRQTKWKDQLLYFYNQKCVYDRLGNPTTYRGLALEWRGRRLTRFADTEYTYDVFGIRTSKTFKDITCKYFYDDNNLIAEQRNGNQTKWIYYIYGTDGIVGFNYEDITYLYRKNLQGDITQVYTEDGHLIAQYAYDAWGNCKVLTPTGEEDKNSDSIGNKNPFRYRGYYFDVDTKLYYLQTRYYDPEVGRFISADSIEYLDPKEIGGLNLYTYCLNNPVAYTDSTGTSKWSDFWNKVGNWFKNTFGGFVSVSRELVSNPPEDYFFAVHESGVVGEIATIGDDSKPISFFAQNASEWWKFWEYQVGVKINIGDFSIAPSFGVGARTITYGYKDTTVSFFSGVEKIGLEVATTTNGVTGYDQYYLRTIPTAVAVVAVVLLAIYAPEVLAAIAAMLQAAMPAFQR